MAADVVDHLLTKYSMDARDYQSGAKKVVDASKSTKAAVKDVGGGVSDLERDFGQLWSGIQAGWNAAEKFIKAVAGIEVALVGLGAMAMKRAADFESLELALSAVEGQGKATADTLAKIKEIAKGPGLGFKEAVQGYIQLRMNDVAPDLAQRLLKEAGNATAVSGGGKEQFGRVLLALSQIAAAGTLQGDELRQLMEAGLPVNRILKDKYGTSRSEDIAKMGVSSQQILLTLADGLSKLGRAGNGAKNTFENLDDTIQFAIAEIGRGLNDVLLPEVNNFANVVQQLIDDGTLKSLGTELGDIANGFFDAATGSHDLHTVLISVGKTTVMVAAALRNFNLNLMEMFDLWSKFTPAGRLANAASGDPLSPQAEADSWEQIQEDEAKLNRQRASKARNKGSGPDQPPLPPESPTQRAQLEKLNEIALNTARSVELQRMAVGGGDIGQYGVSAVELHSIKRPRARGRGDATGMLREAVGYVIADYLAGR